MPEGAKFFGPQHWNGIAKDIRELYAETTTVDPLSPVEFQTLMAMRRTLEFVAIKHALRFALDNPDFDAVKWLNQCSPNPELYPLSELVSEMTASYYNQEGG